MMNSSSSSRLLLQQRRDVQSFVSLIRRSLSTSLSADAKESSSREVKVTTTTTTNNTSSTSTSSSSRTIPEDGLELGDFIRKNDLQKNLGVPSVAASLSHSFDKSTTTSSSTTLFHLKTYGCQMNVSDSDICRSLLTEAGLQETDSEADADVLLTNTCAIREGAEQKVWHRLRELRGRRRNTKGRQQGQKRQRQVVAVLGCMAERLKEDLLQDGMADIVVGPDAYRDLPRLVSEVWSPDIPVEQAVNVQLSTDETYADVAPIRRNPNDISAFVSIQRGCANRCSFCIVPFTRGQERSRPLHSILDEIRRLVEDENVKEVTLLGQNVNSYHDTSDAALEASPSTAYTLSNDGFASRLRRPRGGFYFADLVAQVADLSPELRVRFTSPHPKDYPPALLGLMAERHNVCNHLHMPAQSGSTSMLKRMKRGYTREAYLDLVLNQVLPRIPDVAISSDFISGFCGETEEEHEDTLSLMEQVRYDQAFMFAYSMREKTHAHRTMQDDVPEDVKKRRLQQVIDVFQRNIHEKNHEQEVGKFRIVLLEGESKRSRKAGHDGPILWHGRTDQNKRIIFPVEPCWDDGPLRQLMTTTANPMTDIDPRHFAEVKNGLLAGPHVSLQTGDYAIVQVTEAKGHTLRGRLLWRSTLQRFSELNLTDSSHSLLHQIMNDGANGNAVAA